jgi:hypothetical protein
MNSYTSTKYIFSPRRRSHGGMFIVIPNRVRGDGLLRQWRRPLALLFARVCPG